MHALIARLFLSSTVTSRVNATRGFIHDRERDNIRIIIYDLHNLDTNAYNVKQAELKIKVTEVRNLKQKAKADYFH